MKYFLDTNIIIYAVRGSYSSLSDRFRHVPPGLIGIPEIVNAEIEYGARKSYDYEQTIAVYRSFIREFRSIPFSHEAAVQYGIIRRDLERSGKLIGPNDLLIASTVLAEGGVLVTHNVNEFERIAGLELEDWCVNPQ